MELMVASRRRVVINASVAVWGVMLYVCVCWPVNCVCLKYILLETQR